MSQQKLDTSIIPVINKIITDAEATLLELTGYDVELTIKLKSPGTLTRDEASLIMLQKLVCETFNVSWNEVLSKRRNANIVDARHTYLYILITSFGYINFHAAQHLGVDHTTVTHAVKKMKQYIGVGDRVAEKVTFIKSKLFNL